MTACACWCACWVGRVKNFSVVLSWLSLMSCVYHWADALACRGRTPLLLLRASGPSPRAKPQQRRSSIAALPTRRASGSMSSRQISSAAPCSHAAMQSVLTCKSDLQAHSQRQAAPSFRLATERWQYGHALALVIRKEGTACCSWQK